MECKALEVFCRNLLYVLLVLLAQNDVLDTGSLGCKNFFADAANGQYLAAKGYLACHCQSGTDLSLGQGRGYACGHRDTCTRSVLGHSAFRNMDMQIVVLENTAVDVKFVGMSTDVFEGKQGTFFHDVAQVASKGEFAALAFAQARLDEENLAAYTRPGEACNNACIVVALISVSAEDRFAEQVFGFFFRNGVVFLYLSLSHTKGNTAEELVDLLLKAAYAAFTGITFDDEFQSRLRYLQSGMLRQSVLLAVLRHEMTPGNLNLLLCDVAVNLDELHAVE